MDPKPQTQIFKKYFLFETTRRHESLEGLSSSLAQSAAQLWLAKVCTERANYAFSESFWILSKTVFLAIISVLDMLASQSRALKARILT